MPNPPLPSGAMILYLPSVWPLNSNAVVCEEGEVFWGVYAFRGSGLGARARVGARGSGLGQIIQTRSRAALQRQLTAPPRRAGSWGRVTAACLAKPAFASRSCSVHPPSGPTINVALLGIGRDTNSRRVMAPTAIDGSTSMIGDGNGAEASQSSKRRTFPISGSLAAPHCLAEASATRRHRSGPCIATDVLTVVRAVRTG